MQLRCVCVSALLAFHGHMWLPASDSRGNTQKTVLESRVDDFESHTNWLQRKMPSKMPSCLVDRLPKAGK